jgi:hypothetical protein
MSAAVVTGSPRSCSGAAYCGVRARPAFARELGLLARRRAFLEQLGDAEVEQLDAAVLRHQHVVGLDVAVDDQARMRMRRRGEHVEEKPHARGDIEVLVVAPAVDALAFDVLEDEEGLPRAGDAGIEQAGDVRVGEAGEEAAFALESLAARRGRSARR